MVGGGDKKGKVEKVLRNIFLPLLPPSPVYSWMIITF